MGNVIFKDGNNDMDSHTDVARGNHVLVAPGVTNATHDGTSSKITPPGESHP